MIIKSMSRKSNPAQLIQYVLRYSLKDKHTAKDREQATLILRHNIRSRSLQGYIQEFKENESFRLYKRKDSVVLFHDIISFAPEDKQKISIAVLKDIAGKYVTLRASNALCLAIAHTEKSHTHMHLVTSGLQVNGYSARVSKQQFKTIINQLEAYQQDKYPELLHSINNHDSTRTKTKEEILIAAKAKRQTTKLFLTQQLEKIYSQSASHSEFLSNLKAEKHEVYLRNDKLQGIIVDGKKFRFSRLGFDEEKLQQLETNESWEQEQLTQLRTIRERKGKIIERQRTNNTKSKGKDVSNSMGTLEELESMRHKVQYRPRNLERNVPSDVNHGYDDKDKGNTENFPTLFDFGESQLVFDDSEATAS